MLDNKEFADKLSIYLRHNEDNFLRNFPGHTELVVYIPELYQLILSFLKEGQWMCMRPMTKEEFESDKYA